jgi:hypothetical protein
MDSSRETVNRALIDLGSTNVRISVLIVIFAGILPFLWFKPSFLIANGDYYPYYMSTGGSLNKDIYLWSQNSLGKPSPYPAYVLYGLIWASAQFLRIGTDLLQILLLSFYLSLSAFSMLYLVRSLYPGRPIASYVASTFYVFNFFVMTNLLLNTGFAWVYSFLPLLIVFLRKTLVEMHHRARNVLFLGSTFAMVASISSMNVANEAILIIVLSFFGIYFIYDSQISTLIKAENLIMALAVSVALSIWWIFPLLNFYLFSPSIQLQQDINVASWSWTHSRASFLNLFQLNGFWGWRPEYYPYYTAYSNDIILTFLLFFPFLLASLALMFRDSKRRLNVYLILLVLFFMFLAKGLHEPLGAVNSFLYSSIPLASMFREPVSKFTLPSVLCLALLLGFSAEKVTTFAKRHIGFYASKLFAVGIILVLMISVFPFFTNPLETKTESIPYSSQIQVPQYWYDAADWLNNIPGDFRVLVTPFDDFYHIPYIWGGYINDDIWERMTVKSIISPCYSFTYEVNPNVDKLLDRLRDTIKCGLTDEFDTLMSLLQVRYIVQRNDIDTEYLFLQNRYVLTPQEMRNFLSAQPHLILIKKFGSIDIYEFTEPEPYLRVIDFNRFPSDRDAIIEEKALVAHWNFDSEEQVQEWKQPTYRDQSDSMVTITGQNGTLQFQLLVSSYGWKIIRSPLVAVRGDCSYNFTFWTKTENAHQVHVKIFELDDTEQLSHVSYILDIADGTTDWRRVTFRYSTTNRTTEYLQFQIWSGHETEIALPNTIWIDDLGIEEDLTRLNVNAIEQMLDDSPAVHSLDLINSIRASPTRIEARVNASEEFVLCINEAFDDGWKAYVNGHAYSPFSVFSTMTGFKIKEPKGEMEISIQYEPQESFWTGCIISAGAVTICIAFILYSNINKRNNAKKLTFVPNDTELSESSERKT